MVWLKSFSLGYLSKITKKKNSVSHNIIEEKSDRAEIVWKHAYGQSTGAVEKWFG